MADCSVVLKNGSTYEFPYENIGTAIKWCMEHEIYVIKTPFGMVHLFTKEEEELYESLKFYHES